MISLRCIFLCRKSRHHSAKTDSAQWFNRFSVTMKLLFGKMFFRGDAADNMTTAVDPNTQQQPSVYSDLMSTNTVRRAIAEILGTLMLVLFGCQTCAVWPSGAPPHLSISIGFGMVVMFIVQIFGHISGAHINPAVTLAELIFGNISVPMSIIYLISQLIGACAGYGILLVVTPEHVIDKSAPFCVTLPGDKLSAGQAVLMEALLTAVLIFLVCTVWDPCNSHNTDSTPIKFGLTITALAIVGGPYTGASMNPARSFAPALWTGNWSKHWIYWVGPLLGSGVSAFLYHTVFLRQPAKSKPEELPLNEVDKPRAESA